jgi:hypothetical protein
MYKYCTNEILIAEKVTLYFKFTVNIQIRYTSEGGKSVQGGLICRKETIILVLHLLTYEKRSNASGFTTTLPYNTKVPVTPKHYFLTVRPAVKELTVKTGLPELSYVVV